MFRSSNPSGDYIDDVLQDIQYKVTDQMNSRLTATFTRGKVERAIKQMHPTKAPGPDGFSTLFYQKYWLEVGETTIQNCLDILNNRSLLGNGMKHILLLSQRFISLNQCLTIDQ